MLASVVMMAAFTLVLGVVYPLVITGIGQVAFPWQSNGSLLQKPAAEGDAGSKAGSTVGSALLGQSFSDAKGHPLRQYFQPRPSADSAGYAGTDSGGSNLGPESTELISQIKERKAQVAAFNGVPESEVPVDAVTASGSGLDPDISPAYAQVQVARVARARGLPAAAVEALVAEYTNGPDLGYLGQSTVDVVELNLALDELR
nr:potassium-transporting ATPase subunit KdpC [Planctomonas sp. JC2975]